MGRRRSPRTGLRQAVSKHEAGERSCSACRVRRRKEELVRFVRGPGGRVIFDPAGTQPGRGGYVCRSLECVDLALGKGGLARTLKTSIPAEQASALRRQCVGYLGVENV